MPSGRSIMLCLTLQTALCTAVRGKAGEPGAIAIVGNGPLSPADRAAINGSTTVVSDIAQEEVSSSAGLLVPQTMPASCSVAEMIILWENKSLKLSLKLVHVSQTSAGCGTV